MKKILLSVAVTALLGAPALAQSYDPDLGTGNIAAPPAATVAGSESYAYAPRRAAPTRALPARESTAVYAFGHYRGSDPDANVRLQLRRDTFSDN